MNLSIEVASMLLEACVIALGVVFVGDTLLASSRSLQKVDPSSTANKPKPKSFQWDLLKLGNKLAVLGFVYASAMMFKKGVNGHVDTIYFGLSMACLAYFFTFFGVAIIRQFISDADNTASPTNTDTTPAPKSEPAGKWGNLKLQIVRDMLCLVGRVTSDAETPYKHVLWRLTRSVKQNAVWCTHAEGSSAGIVRAVANISVPIETVLNILIDDSRLPDYDGLYEGQDFIEKVDNHTFLRRLRYKGKWGTQPRDFILLTTWCRLEDNTYLIASGSVQDEIWVVDPKYVRGHVFVSGYHLAPGRNQKDTTELTMCVHADLQGSLPPQMLNALLDAYPLELLAKLEELGTSDVSYRKLVSPLINAPTLDMESRANLRAEGEEALIQLRTVHTRADNGKDPWVTIGEHSGVTIQELRQQTTAWDMLRATCIIQASPDIVRAVLLEKYLKLNPLVANSQVLDTIYEDYKVLWIGSADLWPVNRHDFLCITGIKAMKAGGFILAAKSTVYRTAPSAPTFKRGNLRLGGYVAMPTSSGHTALSVYLHLDVADYMPAWFSYLFAETALPAHMRQIKYACRPDLTSTDTPNFMDILNRIRVKEKKMSTFKLAPSAEDVPSAVQFRLVLNQISNAPQHNVAKKSPSKPKSESGRRSDKRSKTETLSESNWRGRADSNASTTTSTPSRIRKTLFARNKGGSAPSESSKAGSIHPQELEALTQSDEVAEDEPIAPPPAKFASVFAQTATEALDLLALFADVEGYLAEPHPSAPVAWREAATRKGVKVFSAPFADSAWSVLRSETIFECSPADIMKVITDDDRLREFDEMFDRYELLDATNEHGKVRRFMFKAIWPTAPRDFIVLTTFRELENGCYMVATRSVSNEVRHEESRFTRGTVMVSGYYLKPVEGGTAVTMCAHTDLGGTLPSTIINMLSTSAPIQLLTNLRRLCVS